MIYVVRHGQTDYNKIGRLQGKRDIELNARGIHQANFLRDKLSDICFDEIYSSNLRRAYRTASIIAGGQVVIKDKRLEEIGLGDWEGKTYEYLRENDPDYIDFFENPRFFSRYDVESYESLVNRLNDFFDGLDSGKTILVVTHGFAMYTYFESLCPGIEPIKNCEVIIYDKLKNKIIREENRT